MTESAKSKETEESPAVESAEDSLGLQSLRETIEVNLARLEAQSDKLRGVCKAMQRWGKPDALTDFARLEKDFAQWKDVFGTDLKGEFELGAVVDAMQQHLKVGKQRMRKDLGRQLKDACSQAGLKLKVVSREDPVELRIPPLSVVLELDSGKASLLFAKQVLATCPANATDILKQHAATVKRLDQSFDPKEFFQNCLAAYRMGIAATGGKRGERLELVEFMAHMALQTQSKAFFVDPVASNYRGYSRGQFAFDVNRLRQARGLQQDGKRLNFGVATGTTATKKGRVIYMEDEYGQGEFKLNIYFTEGA